MKALLEAGANTKIFAMDDMNAMHFAAQKGHAEVVRQLLNAGEMSYSLPSHVFSCTTSIHHAQLLVEKCSRCRSLGAIRATLQDCDMAVGIQGSL